VIRLWYGEDTGPDGNLWFTASFISEIISLVPLTVWSELGRQKLRGSYFLPTGWPSLLQAVRMTLTSSRGMEAS